ncbi:putative ABC transporter periplasmic binding protein ArtI [Vibrio chagasii]|jgi:arginine transport system substrate-binding protein|uniref:Transporter substrate-binding domain-containing protein n=1 Tax=Vibrio chagasii TaxID=170679 RepID=A0A7Y3YNX2_9VIBR|nr:MULTISPECIES: arginine ABC transporter substrate-binding protein [Vibrio]MDE9380288.1 arginine ABC transporter substrate-binding protein [Vibrio alginolyticus]KAB0476661.1 transporter substrate-binding domain-containing protein [Vibrio chagasii]MBJ2147861.1 arginine ABC transporter substrate-binding protein [Vibrio sp. IB15]MCG9563437.1 arginine ABC transporter substrate-binding protein [Vibrio chagasii]MCG9566863.1 arginine ABC transporter substrate-binding protein [Vibrio chagasii]|eukprot:TRINITY_DN3200_c0_g2_i1.p1 TRINITY_DN3200_c0_g2~~TRINITY_DN3200_c0_g2_i1.p1  ORF type:complete len:244 (-),score=9.39 TRINITY_DN3200_c0_g2_i1:1587-2318(-)
MKKILLASLIGLASFNAAAQEEIKFAMEATYAPFEYMDENNQIQGFDVDLANALCEEMKATCTFHNQAFDSLIPALKFKRYDAAISAMDITEARLQQVNFSDAYYDNSAAFISIEGKVADQAALEGKRIGVQNGSTHQSYLLEQLPGVTAVPYSSYQDAFIDMKNGRIDSVFGDTAVVAEWFKKEDNLTYVGDQVTNQEYFGNGFGIAVNKSNPELVAQLNTALAAVKANGEYDKIFNKYFGK